MGREVAVAAAAAAAAASSPPEAVAEVLEVCMEVEEVLLGSPMLPPSSLNNEGGNGGQLWGLKGGPVSLRRFHHSWESLEHNPHE